MLSGETIAWISLSIIKFIITPSAMITSGESFLSTLITSSIGATIGILFFYNLGDFIFKMINKNRKNKGKLKKSDRKILRLISKRGITGLLLIAPIISVPISSILASKFFNHKKYTQILLIAVFCFWSLVLTTISYYIRAAI